MLMAPGPRCFQKGDYRGKQLREINKWEGEPRSRGQGSPENVVFSLQHWETRRFLHLLQRDDIEDGARWKWKTRAGEMDQQGRAQPALAEDPSGSQPPSQVAHITCPSSSKASSVLFWILMAHLHSQCTDCIHRHMHIIFKTIKRFRFVSLAYPHWWWLLIIWHFLNVNIFILKVVLL